jgi:hypothetical protein
MRRRPKGMLAWGSISRSDCKPSPSGGGFSFWLLSDRASSPRQCLFRLFGAGAKGPGLSLLDNVALYNAPQTHQNGPGCICDATWLG